MDYNYIIDLESVTLLQNKFNEYCKNFEEKCGEITNSALASCNDEVIIGLYNSLVTKYNQLKSANATMNDIFVKYINAMVDKENELASLPNFDNITIPDPRVIDSTLLPKIQNTELGSTIVWPDNSELAKISTKDIKIEQILKEYGLTRQQFYEVCAIVFGEAKSGSYTDAYAVINAIYNRTSGTGVSNWITNKLGKEKGQNIWYQATYPEQFVAYKNSNYYRYLKKIQSKESFEDFDDYVMDAVIDFLTTKESMHNHQSFRDWNANYVGVRDYYDYGGNMYFD